MSLRVRPRGGCGRDILTGNIGLALAPMSLNFAPLLRRVVLVRQPALGARFDFQGVGLGAVRGSDHAVMSLFGAIEPRGFFGLTPLRMLFPFEKKLDCRPASGLRRAIARASWMSLRVRPRSFPLGTTSRLC